MIFGGNRDATTIFKISPAGERAINERSRGEAGHSVELIREKEKERRLAMREEERRKVMGERTCPRCGASLDPCEKCDCLGAVVVPEIVDRTEELEKLVSKNIKGE